MEKRMRITVCMLLAAVLLMLMPAQALAAAELKNPFKDVDSGAYYYDSVMWAVANGITAGTSPTTFAPNNPCTRGQIVTFLWRAKGSPEPRTIYNPFADVKSTDYYYKAVLWAVEEGITAGTSANTFAPGNPCTRGQVATFLWKTAGSPAPSNSGNPFNDVAESAYYCKPVLWAVEKGITSGVGSGRFAPSSTCTRGQIATFLCRYMNLEEDENDYSGTVMLYSSASEDLLINVKAGFEKKYPNVTLEYYFAGSGQIMTKLSTEMQTGTVACDVVLLASADPYVTWENEGYLLAYNSPHLANIPAVFRDSDNTWCSAYTIIMGLGYAETLCDAGEAPTTFKELTDPEWKDNFVMPDPSTAGTTRAAVWALVNHPDYGWDYFRKLKENGIGLESSTGNAENRVVGQAYKAGLGCDYRFRNLIDNGTPVGFNVTEDVIPICPCPIAIPKDCPNEKLAKLLYDWILDPEGGQKLMASEYNLTVVNQKTDLPADAMAPEDVAELAIDVNWEAMVSGTDDMLEEFDKIFKPSEAYAGTVTLYSSSPEDMLIDIKEAFEDEYPQVNLQYYFAGSGQIVTKLSAEMRTGAVACDVVWLASADPYVAWESEGYLLAYDSPHLADIPDVFRDSDNTWCSAHAIIMGLGYAETLCTAAEAPATFEELADPEWKNSFVMPDPSTAGTTRAAVWALVNHPDYGWDYFRKLKENGIGLESSTGNAENRVVGQAYKAGLGCDYRFRNLIDNGTPVGFNVTEDVIPICPGPIAIPKACPDEELAKLLYDWLLDPEGGQKLMANEYNMTVVNQKTDLPANMMAPEDVAELAIDVDWEAMANGMDDMLKRFDEIFKS